MVCDRDAARKLAFATSISGHVFDYHFALSSELLVEIQSVLRDWIEPTVG
jgi:hypothetical protein